MQILSSSALGDDDNGDGVTNSMGTFSTSTYNPYDSEEEQSSTPEDSKPDTKQVYNSTHKQIYNSILACSLTSLAEVPADSEETGYRSLNYTKQVRCT